MKSPDRPHGAVFAASTARGVSGLEEEACTAPVRAGASCRSRRRSYRPCFPCDMCHSVSSREAGWNRRCKTRRRRRRCVTGRTSRCGLGRASQDSWKTFVSAVDRAQGGCRRHTGAKQETPKVRMAAADNGRSSCRASARGVELAVGHHPGMSETTAAAEEQDDGRASVEVENSVRPTCPSSAAV